MIMVYLPTSTTNISQMWVIISYMDLMGMWWKPWFKGTKKLSVILQHIVIINLIYRSLINTNKLEIQSLYLSCWVFGGIKKNISVKIILHASLCEFGHHWSHASFKSHHRFLRVLYQFTSRKIQMKHTSKNSGKIREKITRSSKSLT